MTNELPTTVLKVNHHPAKHIAERYLYAAFGSNLLLEQMAHRCPDAEIITSGKLPGHRLIFARVASIVTDEKSSVPVGIYKLSADDIEKLDRFEGMGRTYDRYLVTVLAQDGTAKRCFTYVKRDQREQAPSAKYYAKVLGGYTDWKFDDRRLRHARKRAETATHDDRMLHEKNAEDMWHDWMSSQRSFGSVDRRGRVTVHSNDDQMQFSLVTGRCRKCGTTHEGVVCPSKEKEFAAASHTQVEWGQRDGLLYWRIKGTRVWRLDVTTKEDEASGLVRGRLAVNLPGSKAFTPKDK